MEFLELIVAAVAVALATSIWRFLVSFAWRPYMKAKRIREQGVRGPKGSFWSGCAEEISAMKAANRDMELDINSNDYLQKVLPQYVKWTSLYGETFTYSVGRKQRIFISDAELVKQVLSNKFGFYKKLDAGPGITSLLGKGLVFTDGEQWVRHRKVVNPAFTMDKIKAMTRTMADCAKSMLDTWHGKKELEVSILFQELTADVISHTAFGSSYSAGKEVFCAQKELQMLVLASFLKFELPIKRYLPTESNKRRWRLEKKIRETLLGIIEKRLASKELGYGDDLLGLMMEAWMTGKEGTNLSMDEIIDECKTFFFAGHETTSHLLTWTMFLLSTHQDWQERLREEVLSECGRDIPDPDKISKLKWAMTRTMADCAKSMLDTWHGKKELEVSILFQELTADVISHTAFGSSYSAGKEVFCAQKELQMLVLASFLKFELPIKRYLPTESNKRRWRLEKKIRETLLGIIEKRLASKELGYGDDLLGLMMEAWMTGKEGTNLSMDEIIDECKTFFFAGHETTSHLLTWTMFLLSTHQDWQERLREEVLSECGRDIPDPDKISKLKWMTMVIFEALRLYSPVSVIARTALMDTKLGNLAIPKDMDIMIPIAIIHHSKELWGPDANEFNPLRFENGASMAAKHANAMMAFSIGPRACVGQSFALMEAKTVLSMILQRFSFTISAHYKHMPADMLTLQPQKGLPIVLEPLEA